LVYDSISGAEICASTLQKQDYKAAIRKYRKALRYLDVCWEKEEIDEGNYSALTCLPKLLLFYHMTCT
jgi:peptidyl-prolyl isomerase D